MNADPTTPPRFALTSRLLHWGMAVMVVAQLFLGVAMVASLDAYHLLRTVHMPLGFAILVLVVVRIGNRLRHPPPPFPTTMRPLERRVATASEYLLYALLVIQPLTGWAMLSAGGYPIAPYGPLHLPGIAPHDPGLYALLRQSHTALAYLLFAAFTAHMCAVVFHTLALRDRTLDRMALWRGRRERDDRIRVE
ncbi:MULTISPECIES: cytochrome b [unclassified Rhodococcus (in: high G+C Gram-positive bacteria)]|uniref:cytochrome b n=1 Tax=unclassified Rhodococcus (in: high G+C Gram-positive bacteria) TaxID=192944 RepID=UPI0016395483|nr:MULTISPECIES: cytochrome b [unclassified Rhodococcus (in: high G+C Gram-positive bacteria)]MBC2639798.1 cytochrome b [Rhodococcus sp. 3A]MBC2895457.1 cytochrome b [Rhodococcus sp. 4CII]